MWGASAPSGALSSSVGAVHPSFRPVPHAGAGDSPVPWPGTNPAPVFVQEYPPTVAVKIRLKRLGKIRTPHYRIVVADSRTKRDGRAIEEIGQYHPKNDPSVIQVDSERAQYWLSVGAQPTEAVVALFKRTGDWQKFSGDTSPSGVDPQPEKRDKLAAFNAALAEKGSEPVSAAITSEKSEKSAAASEQPADDTETAADEKAEA